MLSDQPIGMHQSSGRWENLKLDQLARIHLRILQNGQVIEFPQVADTKDEEFPLRSGALNFISNLGIASNRLDWNPIDAKLLLTCWLDSPEC